MGDYSHASEPPIAGFGATLFTVFASLRATTICGGSFICRDAFLHIAQMGFVESTTNIIVTGPAGSGKTYLACSLGVEACKKRFSNLLHKDDRSSS